jgi:uncharacterized protein YgiM (DUF1202 family)
MKRRPERVGRVIRDYDSPYSEPIIMRAGEKVSVGERESEWEGWIWCTAAKEKSRWVPESYVQRCGDVATLLRDYEATELSVRAGDEVLLGQEVAGWVWCTNERGHGGWVPADCVGPP